ncbi:MAG: glycine--tRNA ligase, partial [Alphaproteobacteria bacterium]|nr:glycine--tRNA ligase [Alphaproteobacteria bacterium]
GNIGKSYRRHDEIGTPMCITIDFQTLEDDSVTIRDRDSMEQIRLNIAEVSSYFQSNLL